MRCLFILCLLTSLSAAAPKVAVLEAVVPTTSASDRMAWTDTVRGAVRAQLPARFIVLSRANIESFLPPGMDLADCEGECDIETGRKVGAEYVVSTRIERTGDRWRVAVALHATIDGRFLGQGQQLTAGNGLTAGLTQAVHRAIAPLVESQRAQPATGIEVVDANALHWMGEPVVLIRSDPEATVYRQGQLLGTTPIRVLLAGKQSVEVTLSAQGHTAQRFRLVTGGLSGQVDLELESQIGVVQIRAPVDNPKVQVDGRMIVVGHEHTLPVGRHTLHVMHPCADYEPVTVDVKPDAYTIVDPKVRSPCGQVTIKSDTPGATVLIGTEAYPLPHTLSRAVSWTRKFWVHAPGRVAKTLMVEPTKEDVTLQVNFGPRSAAERAPRTRHNRTTSRKRTTGRKLPDDDYYFSVSSASTVAIGLRWWQAPYEAKEFNFGFGLLTDLRPDAERLDLGAELGMAWPFASHFGLLGSIGANTREEGYANLGAQVPARMFVFGSGVRLSLNDRPSEGWFSVGFRH